MVVDDDHLNRVILTQTLKAEYTVLAVNSGEEALAQLADFHPDLMLLDISMTGIDGYEVCKTIRRNPEFMYIRIILVSAGAKVEERMQGYQAGADDYVTKPFVAQELLAKVKVFLRLKNAKELDRLKQNLLTLISHETRTPLSGILGFSEVLSEEEGLTPPQLAMLNEIHQAGKRLFGFVERAALLCDLVESPRLDLEIHSLWDVAQGAMRVVETAACTAGVQLSLTGEPLSLRLDLRLLQTALEYLLDNAIKFSSPGSQVVVRLGQANSRPQIVITDQGVGIDPSWIGNIFDLFAIQKVENHKAGQGLSLAICRQIMVSHGGRIEVASQPGQGTSFTLSFPPSSLVA